MFVIDIQFRLISKLFSELKFPNFFENSGYFWKIPKLQKTNFSETRENEKFRNFQGLTFYFDRERYLYIVVVAAVVVASAAVVVDEEKGK